MSRSLLWREFETGDGPLLRLLRFVVLAGGVLFLCYTGVLLLGWKRQLLFAAVTIAIAVIVNRRSRSHLGTLTLLLLSIYSTFRYAFWRTTGLVAFLRDPLSNWTGVDAAIMLLLLLAECYAFTTLVLGYVQVLWPLQRVPVPLPDDPEAWPAIDLLIPTYNEPLSIVRSTALAAMNIDWPLEKLHVFLLDDGQREQVRAFAEEAEIGYIARSARTHAKAGNLNHALRQVRSPYVAVFDCDHVPTRSFLQLTMGWMLRDRELAMLQTPHHTYSPDPFERNLDQHKTIPPESELYYRVVQDGNDFWNAASFCGSSAVLRRSALDKVGGFAVETLTEDAHTSLRLQMHGYNTAYINIPQSAGLAPERLIGYIRQQTRWARGMLHILRLENPLLAPGLSFGQRLCYFHAMTHFLFALPRLIFLTAPLAYLLFGRSAIPGFWGAIVAYALPHLVLSAIASARIQREHRHPFWDHVYETVLAPFLLLPSLHALLRGREHPFEITPKGGVVDNEYFDRRVAWPFLMLLCFNIAGVLAAVARLVHFRVWHVPGWLQFVNVPAHLYDPHHAGVVAVNLVWVFFNIVLLGVAVAVARETRQRRRAVRLAVSLPSDVVLADGSMLQGLTCDLSNGGVRTRVADKVRVRTGEAIQFVFPLLDGTATFPAKVVGQDGNELRARFEKLSLQEHEALVTLLYSRANAWLNWNPDTAASSPLQSLGHLLRLALVGLTPGARVKRRKQSLATSIVPALLVLAFAMTSRSMAQNDGASVSPIPSRPPAAPALGVSPAAPSLRPSAPAGAVSVAAGDFQQTVSLAQLGLRPGAMMRGLDTSQQVRLFLSRDRLVKAATLSLRYRTSAGASQLMVRLNGAVVGTLPVAETVTTASLALPVDVLNHDNRLSFEFAGGDSAACVNPGGAAVWAQIDSSSTLELSGSRLTMTADLASLPLPFYDIGNAQPVIPIVFLVRPSPKAMQAASIVASWFGALAAPRGIRFPVSIASVPATNAMVPSGNAIVLAENNTLLPESLKDAAVSGAAVALHANPSDPMASVLIVSGTNADELLTAALALVLHQSTWQGPRVAIRNFVMPAARRPGDAPRWLRTDAPQSFTELTRSANGQTASRPAEELQTTGPSPVTVRLMLPPDLDFGDRENLPLRLDYRYNSVPLGEGSTLEVYVNGAYVSSTPMPRADRASRVLETVVPVPVADLRPGANTLEFRFLFQRAPNGNCAGGPPPTLEGAVVGDSSLDITGISHSVVLPDLRPFSSAGFPFTNLADLGETAVAMPEQPTNAELETLLLLMGRFGAQTGHPAVRVEVIRPEEMRTDGARDYLVLGTKHDQSALDALKDASPVQLDGETLRIRNIPGLLSPRRWWSGPAPLAQSELLSSGGAPDAVIQEFGWPAGTNRTVVAVILKDDAAAQRFGDAFADPAASDDIRDTVSVLRGGRFSSTGAGVASYRVGENTLLERATRTLQQFPWIVAVVAAILCFLIAVLLQARLRIRARARLHGDE